MNAIVVTFDRLPIGLLACCGNGWIATPNFDRLAAESVLFQQHFADSPAAESAFPAWWSGRHQWRGSGSEADRLWLPTLFAEHGVTLRLLVESAAETGADPMNQFPAKCTETVHGSDDLDVSPEETPFFRLVSRAQRDLRLLRTSRREPWLLWLKSRGVPMPWLAPRQFATQFLDLEEDDADDEAANFEPAGDEPEEPHDDESAEQGVVEMSGDQFDELLRSVAQLPPDRKGRDALSGVQRGLMRRVCGGYVALLDAALGRLLDQVAQETASAPTLLIVTAARGLALREPGPLSRDCEPLAEEMVHLPLFVRPPGMNRGVRRQDLSQTVDLFPTLAEWFGIELSGIPLDGKSLLPLVRGDDTTSRSHLGIADGGKTVGIRTSEFYLVVEQARGEKGGEQRRRLFAKPEDIWETNDVSAQSPDVVDQLAAQLKEIIADKDETA